MKLATLMIATLAASTLSVQASGVVFDTPVTYTQSVTYAAGVTYLAPVTYSLDAAVGAQAAAAAAPVLLDRVIVTPTRTYAEKEWRTHLAGKKTGAQLYPVKSERRIEGHTGTRSLQILFPFQ